MNPYDWEFHEDPYPVYRALRERAPLYRNEELGFWALSRHADVLNALKDWETYSNAEGVALESFSPDVWKVMFFLAMDPPRHDRLRALVGKAFTPRRVEEIGPELRERARRYLDGMLERGECDFIGDFAGKIPMDVISEMIGVPEVDRDMVRGWADAVMHREEGSMALPAEGAQAVGNLLGYFREILKNRRRSAGEDMTAALVRAEVEGDRLGDDEIVGFLFLMTIAGNETTTKLLGNAIYWMGQHPKQLARVRADHGLVPAWVEETLRFDNSSQILYRTMARETELHGQVMRPGDRVALLIGSANRDERAISEPDRYDIDRDCSNSLSFGRGVHFCLGANLARLEARICLEELLLATRSHALREEGLVRVHSGNVRGFASMPIAVEPA